MPNPYHLGHIPSGAVKVRLGNVQLCVSLMGPDIFPNFKLHHINVSIRSVVEVLNSTASLPRDNALQMLCFRKRCRQNL